jgi:hypothetical protein
MRIYDPSDVNRQRRFVLTDVCAFRTLFKAFVLVRGCGMCVSLVFASGARDTSLYSFAYSQVLTENVNLMAGPFH